MSARGQKPGSQDEWATATVKRGYCDVSSSESSDNTILAIAWDCFQLSSSILSRRACTICMVTPKEDYSICRAQLWKWKQDLVAKTLVNLLSRERWIAVLQAESSDRYSHWIRFLWPDSLAYQCHDALRSTKTPKDKQGTVLGRFQWHHLEAREKRTNIERIGKHIAHSRYLPTCRQKIHAESMWMIVNYNDRTKQTDSSIVLTLHPLPSQTSPFCWVLGPFHLLV